MELIGSKLKPTWNTSNQKGNIHQKSNANHILHRRYSMQDQKTNPSFCKMEDRNVKEQNQLLYTKYQQLFQLFKKKQIIEHQQSLPFQHIVTNELTKTVTNLHVLRRNKLRAKEWHKLNYDRCRFMSKQSSVEKIVTNRNIEPCLKVSRAGRNRDQQNKIKTEQVCQQEHKCKCLRSKSFQRDNLIIFLVDENQIPNNQ